MMSSEKRIILHVVRSILDHQSMLEKFYPNYIKHCEQIIYKHSFHL